MNSPAPIERTNVVYYLIAVVLSVALILWVNIRNNNDEGGDDSCEQEKESKDESSAEKSEEVD